MPVFNPQVPHFDIRDFGAVAGVTAGTSTGINAALSAANTAGGGIVFVPKGTWYLDAQLSIYSNTTLQGVGPASILIAKSSMTWTGGGLVKVGTTGQSVITIRDLTIDGNRVNNLGAYNYDRQLVAILDADDFTVQGCTIKNSTGIGVYTSTGKRTRVLDSRFDVCVISPIYIWSATANVTESRVRIEGNVISNSGRHSINVMGHNDVIIANNTCTGMLVTGLQVDFAGAAVFRDSGSDFANNLIPGNFLVADPNGTFTEFGINSITDGSNLVVGTTTITTSSVASPSVITAAAHGLVTGDVALIANHTGSTPDINGTHTVTVTGTNTFTIPVNVTVGGTGGTVGQNASNVTPVAGGTGDMIEVQGCQDVVISGNHVQTGVSIGISVWTNESTADGRSVVIANNRIRNIGGPGISIGSANSNTLTGVLITGNIISNCGRRGDAGGASTAADYNVGIVIQEDAAITHSFIDGNLVYDDDGPTTKYWLNTMSAVDAGDITVGRNYARGLVNNGIANAVTITPGAGWGTTATVTNTVFHGTSLIFTITSGGSGIAANPTVAIVPKVVGPEDPPLPVGILFNLDTAAHEDLTVSGATNASVTFTYWQTPVSGQRCQFIVHW